MPYFFDVRKAKPGYYRLRSAVIFEPGAPPQAVGPWHRRKTAEAARSGWPRVRVYQPCSEVYHLAAGRQPFNMFDWNAIR